jgi:hypothetical protein
MGVAFNGEYSCVYMFSKLTFAVLVPRLTRVFYFIHNNWRAQNTLVQFYRGLCHVYLHSNICILV